MEVEEIRAGIFQNLIVLEGQVVQVQSPSGIKNVSCPCKFQPEKASGPRNPNPTAMV